MIVGEKGYPKKAYVYVENGDTWTSTDTLVGDNQKEFGKFVAVHDTTIVVSNHKYSNGGDSGFAYVYKLISGECLPSSILSKYQAILHDVKSQGNLI